VYLACEFFDVLRQDGLLTMFEDAGNKMRQLDRQWNVLSELVDELDNPDKTRRQECLKLCDQAEMEWDEMREYSLFSDPGELQPAFLQAQDYDDKVSEHLTRFYACPHCGFYFFSKLWSRMGSFWYCRLDFDTWCELAEPDEVKQVQEVWGMDLATWPVVGCLKQYHPFELGPGTVIEYCTSGNEWKAFRADLVDEVLDDLIKTRQVEHNGTMAASTPADVYDRIPRTYPKVNPVPLAGFDQFPGIGHFDLKSNMPALTLKGWIRAAVRVAMDSLEYPVGVFSNIITQMNEICESLRPSF
jgi:hypothetical protein